MMDRYLREKDLIMQKKMYQLMLKDKCICYFELGEEASFGMNPIPITFRITDENKYRTFISNDTTINGLYEWLNTRKPTRNRANLCGAIHISGINNYKTFIETTKLLSLTDALWVKSDGDIKSTWNNLNFYNNPFNEAIQLSAFSGKGSYGTKVRKISPEWLTDGCLPKCWKRINGKIYLCKGSLNPTHKYPHEPFMEVFASQLAQYCGINCVQYTLGKIQDTLVSKCQIFTSEELGYLRIADVEAWSEYSYLSDMIKLYSNNKWLNQFVDMITLDALILNIDRHLGNFGFFRDNRTGKLAEPTPIFDNGAGLAYSIKPVNNLEDAKKAVNDFNYFSEFDIPFDKLLKKLAAYNGKNIIRILNKAEKFRYTQNKRFPLDKNIAEKWENTVHNLAAYYLRFISS